MAPIPTPLAGSKFSLNSAAVAGFFGGKEAISAMSTVHLYQGRCWLGWFNSPGSYTVAKRFGRMANSRFWDGLFPGPNDSPAVSLGLDGKKGPNYIAALSGTELSTRHLAYLTMECTKSLRVRQLAGRMTKPYDVTYLAMKEVPRDPIVPPLPIWDALFGIIPITASIVTCMMCALVYDWYGFSMILFGIISSGWASFVIGRGKLIIKWVDKPSPGVPPGHGILVGEDGVIVIKGKERDVNVITKGGFDLVPDANIQQTGEGEDTITDPDLQQTDEGEDTVTDPDLQQTDEGEDTVTDPNLQQTDEGEDAVTDPGLQQTEKGEDTVRKHHDIGICSLLLLLQFLLQLLLIPQAPLFGQMMFCVSLGVSWMYNSYLSSLDKEKTQTDILFRKLGDPEMWRFRAGTRTTMTVFACLLLFHNVEPSSREEDAKRRIKILHSCLPKDTAVWERWGEKVVEQLLQTDEELRKLSYLREDEKDRELADNDKKLLQTLLNDATAAFKEYLKIRNCLPSDSSCSSPDGVNANDS